MTKKDESPTVPAEVVEGEPGTGVPAVVGTVPNDPSQYPPDEELPLPRVTLLQPTAEAVTVGGHKAGAFLNNLTDEEFPSIQGIILAMGMSRTRWGEGEKSKEVLCKAVDHETGKGDPGGSCAACSLKDWGPDDLPIEKRKPKCKESYDFVALDEQGLPFITSAHGTGIKQAKRFIAGAKAKGLPLYCFHVEVSARRTSNEKGTFYIPVFAFRDQTDPDTWPELSTLAARLLAAMRREPVERSQDDDSAGEF